MLRVEHLGPYRGLRPASLPELEPVLGRPSVRLGLHQLPDVLRALLLAPLQEG